MESFSQSIQSGADQKANEYAERIRKGEDPEQVMQGLGPAFRGAVESKLSEFKSENKVEDTEEKRGAYEDLIDETGFAGALSQENLQRIYGSTEEKPIEVESVKLPEENQEAVQVVQQEEVKRQEKEKEIRQKEQEERKIEDQKQIKKIREELGISEKQDTAPVEEITREQLIDEIKDKIKTNLEGLTFEELKEQTKLQSELVYREYGGSGLGDALFAAGKGNFYESADGTKSYFYESVDGKIGEHFDAHGIAKLNQFSQLMNLLENGIDSSKDFYTAPFEISNEDRAGAGAGLGTSGGTVYKDGIAVVTSGFDQKLGQDGIKHVFLNDVYQNLREPLAAAFPQYQIHLLSEQKPILEAEAMQVNKKTESVESEKTLEEIIPQIIQQEQTPKVSQVVEIHQEEKTEQVPESIETASYTPDQLQNVLSQEIANVNFGGTVDRILQGMYDRYRSTDDSVFGPRYQNEISEFIPGLKKAETVQDVAGVISRLNDVLDEMVRNVEYGAFSGMDNRDRERSELAYLAEDFDALKHRLNNNLENALFEITGKQDDNPEFVQTKQAIKSLNSAISEFVNVLYDKADKLR